MHTVVLTKTQMWQIANIFEKYNVDQIRLHVDHSNGIGPVITLQYGDKNEKIDITDISNW
jgi:hypothetical protein